MCVGDFVCVCTLVHLPLRFHADELLPVASQIRMAEARSFGTAAMCMAASLSRSLSPSLSPSPSPLSLPFPSVSPHFPRSLVNPPLFFRGLSSPPHALLCSREFMCVPVYAPAYSPTQTCTHTRARVMLPGVGLVKGPAHYKRLNLSLWVCPLSACDAG